MRLRRYWHRWWVADEDGWCAGNQTRKSAMEYGRQRATLGHTTTVVERRRDYNVLWKVFPAHERGPATYADPLPADLIEP